MGFVIVDERTGEIYQRRCGATGWYSTDPTQARIYTLRQRAEQTIRTGNHHVTYPGGRVLIVKEIATCLT